MATLGATLPTLLDVMKTKDPDGTPARIVEMLNKQIPVLQDMRVMEGNLPTGHQVTIRSALPSVGAGLAWRKMNSGVAPGKSRSDQFTETCGTLDGYSTVDKAVAEANGDAAAYRLGEDAAFMEGLGQAMESAIFYSSTLVNPEQIGGLAPRLNATAGNPAASQIILHDAAPAGADQTSIWGIVWGEHKVYGIYPKGTVGGLQHTDYGVELVTDSAGRFFPAYRSWFDWRAGICVADWRFLVRVANIDTSALNPAADTLIPKMISAYHKLERADGVVWYCNRLVHEYLHLQARNAVSDSTLSLQMIEGKPIVSFLGAPIRSTDSLLNTESIVS